MNVTLPDGTTIQGVPDGISKADLTAKLARNGYDVSKLAEPSTPAESFPQQLGRQVLNAGAGALRGAGSIGATLLAGSEYGRDPGTEKLSWLEDNRKRRADMDAALASLGANTNSLAYQGGKLGGEVAGTAGIGGVVANSLRAIPGLTTALPRIIPAIESAGFSTRAAPAATLAGKAADMGARVLGGAVTGGAAAGLVNPEDAATGAAIGGALPPSLAALGKVGKVVGGVIRGPAQSEDMRQAVISARANGLVIPPTQANPTLANRVLEGFSGKITTAQNASAKNQPVIAGMVTHELGLPPDTKITIDVLDSVRKSAGQAYEAIGTSGVIRPGEKYAEALDRIAIPHLTASVGFPSAKVSPVVDMVNSLRSEAFDASSAVAKIKELRSAADDAFRTGNTDIGRASKSAANALEDAIEVHLQQTGNTELLDGFKQARKLIAKTYSVQKALNTTTGAIDARKLGAQLKADKPLSGGLKDVAEFANRFPKATQTIEGMGSLPQTSPLDWIPAGALSMATSNPLLMAGVLARPAARASILSPMVQNRLMQQPSSIARLLERNPEAANALYRAIPVGLAGDR
jgi:hypothetical protein